MAELNTHDQLDIDRLLARLDTLAEASEPGPGVTRRYLTPEHRAAAEMLIGWMVEAGMDAGMDAVGNVVGRYEGTTPGQPSLLLGSHLDSVIQGGRYDGPLGILAPLECVAALSAAGRRLPFAIEIVGFGDEEGARFRTTLVGSRGIAGTFDDTALLATDADGNTMDQAMCAFGLDPSKVAAAARQPGDILAYVEFHIEQGPVLEADDLAVGVVTAISGQTRLNVIFKSAAGHAGTVPMALRHDPLLAAAEMALAAESTARSHADMVATIGQLDVTPGASNVIPGKVIASIDLRAADDDMRRSATDALRKEIDDIAHRRGVGVEVRTIFDMDATPCTPWLMLQLDRAITGEGLALRHLPSGAGHDGMAMRAIADIAMLFLRCEGGISHNPGEAVTAADIATGTRILMRFIENCESQ